MHRRARLLLLAPLVAAGLAGPLTATAGADDTGHDHSTMDTGTTHTGTTQTHDHEHEHGTAPPEDRPLGLLLGTFGGVNGAVVLGAAVVRWRERTARLDKQARRSQGRAIPTEVGP